MEKFLRLSGINQTVGRLNAVNAPWVRSNAFGGKHSPESPSRAGKKRTHLAEWSIRLNALQNSKILQTMLICAATVRAWTRISPSQTRCKNRISGELQKHYRNRRPVQDPSWPEDSIRSHEGLTYLNGRISWQLETLFAVVKSHDSRRHSHFEDPNFNFGHGKVMAGCKSFK